MKQLVATAALLSLATPLSAQDAPVAAPSPNEIVEAAPQADWTAIAPEDLMVMTLAPDTAGKARQVVIQLIPPPFSQGWVENIRKFARAGWYDNISVNRVQDNYVVQWGDPNYDNPEATGETKPLPEGLKVMGEEEYASKLPLQLAYRKSAFLSRLVTRDSYADYAFHLKGWPVGMVRPGAPRIRIVPQDETPAPMPEAVVNAWPTHCYGMVGVGRGYSPDTGTGAELYTVIGTPPRHLDRNIALVGRVIEGMENLSSLPRGKGELGFYGPDELAKRTPILTVRIASDLPAAEQPHFEYLSTESQTFADYAEARANRRDPFFITPAGGADICNIPVPVRRVN